MDRRSSNRESNVNASSWRPSNGIFFDTCNDNHRNDYGDFASSVTNQLLPVSSSSPSASTSSLSGYIEHPVSQFDTLAGVAIRYGVEVADVKRLNGLATDIQMFALKSLHIPLPGRHPPSTCLSNGFNDTGECSSELTPPHHVRGNLFDSFQSLRPKSSPLKISPAMSSLQGYYGLKFKEQRTNCGNLEMAALEKGSSRYLEDIRATPGTNPPLTKHRKSRSLIIDFLTEEGDAADQTPSSDESTDRWFEKIERRRQKSESNFTGMSMTPEMVLREDKGAGNGGFSASAGKCLALRSKAITRISLLASANDTYPMGSGDPVGPNGSLSSVSVRKSSSTSSLQDQEMNGSLSMWPTSKWSLKPDLQSLSTAAITKPIFDGLPRPVTSRRNKAALD